MDNSTETIFHPNGTTSVISVLQVKDPKNQVGNEVICQVQHLGTLTDFRQALNNGKRTNMGKEGCGHTYVHTSGKWRMFCRTPQPLSKEANEEKMD